jgi:hypothetical protein
MAAVMSSVVGEGRVAGQLLVCANFAKLDVAASQFG